MTWKHGREDLAHLPCAAEWCLVKTAAVIGHKATDKKWDVPGKIANRKGRPEPKKKKTAAADETSERRKSIVSQKNLKS